MLNNKEVEAVSKLDANARYVYSIKRIVDFETLWVLVDEKGIRTYGDNAGNIIVPIWPSSEYASRCREGEFSECKPEDLQLDEFIEDYIGDFKKQGYKLTILPLPSDKGAVVDIDSFLEAIQQEEDNY